MHKKRVVLIGAGEAGLIFLNEIKKDKTLNYWIVGFLDDFKKEGEKIENLPILGKIQDIQEVVKEYDIEEIIIAIPSIDKERLKQIIDKCEETGIQTKILPSSYESLYTLKTGRPWYKQLRPVKLEDLLKRKPILLNYEEIKNYVENKTILITGGGGSIGSEICRQLAELNPTKLILLDNSEYNLFMIDKELREKHENLNIISKIIDVRDRTALREIAEQNKIDTIFHTAAYKHVPLMEDNIKEAIKNNIFGSYNILELANDYKVNDFILISTDKAVNPTSIMGTTKRITEMLMHFFSNSHTKYIAVRFGNVLGSKGSIIPIFEEQIDRGGPVTITHPEMKRYFMTLSEAAQLVIQAGAIGEDKQILVLDMGEQYKIKNIAEELIKLKGLTPEKDIKIKYIGIRPGERLYEILLNENEKLTQTKHERILLGKSEEIDKIQLRRHLSDLKDLIANGDKQQLIQKLKDIVPEYSEEEVHEDKVLITGSTGFIGTHLKKRLKDLNIPFIEASKTQGVDLNNKEQVNQLPNAKIVIHLASTIPQKAKNQEDFRNDIQIMNNILEYCKKNNSKLIFTSSAAVYPSSQIPLKEDTFINPESEYGKSKAYCEQLFLNSNIKGFILRIFNVYGEGQKPPSIIPNILNSINSTEYLQITQNSLRDFIHISDLIEAIILTIKENIGKVEIINLGTGNKTPIDHLPLIIQQITNRNIKFNPIESNYSNYQADISKAKSILNWEPETSIEDGLKNIIKLSNIQ